MRGHLRGRATSQTRPPRWRPPGSGAAKASGEKYLCQYIRDAELAGILATGSALPERDSAAAGTAPGTAAVGIRLVTPGEGASSRGHTMKKR
jgi:hypothetical protein